MECLSSFASIGVFVTQRTKRARAHTTNILHAYYPNTLWLGPVWSLKASERVCDARKKKFTFGVVNKKSNKNFTRIVRTYFNMRYQNIYTISLSLQLHQCLLSLSLSLTLCVSLLEPKCCSFMACNSHYYFYYHRQFYKSKRNTQFAYNLHNANTLCVSRTICFM